MSEITLYTYERAGAGLTTTNVCRVKGSVVLRVIREGITHEYHIKDSDVRGVETLISRDTHPVRGKADLFLKMEGREIDINLIKCMWAVALVASFGQSGTIYWIKEGQCYEINDRVAVPKSEIEGRYLPEQGYELPPQID